MFSFFLAIMLGKKLLLREVLIRRMELSEISSNAKRLQAKKQKKKKKKKKKKRRNPHVVSL